MGMGAPVEKAKSFGTSLKRLVRYLRPRMASLIAVVVLAVASTLFSVLAPKIMGNATTMIFTGLMGKMRHVAGAAIDFASIGRIVVLLIGLYTVSALFGFLQQFIMAGVAQKTVYDMRRDVSEKLSRLPLSFFDGRTHGEIMSRVTNDMDNISGTLQQSLGQIITSLVTILGVIVMMLTISPLLTAITLVVLPLSFVMTRIIAPRSQKYFAQQWKHIGELNGHVEEMYTGHPIVKAFGYERKSIEKFIAVNEKVYDASWRAQFVSGLLFPLMTFINNIGYVAVAVAGGILVTRRAIAIGDVQAFIQYSRQFTMPIAQAANIANVLQSTVASAERVFELLDEQEEVPDSPGAAALASPRGNVRFENVRFSYAPDAPLISGMNLDVKEGQTIAIVGPTGAGKTTLVNLLMRFYETQEGRITVDGVDIRDVPRGSLRRTFGMVLQETWLFNGTIRDNIAYGRDVVTEEEVHQAAVAAHADHFIRTLPEGYNTVLNAGAEAAPHNCPGDPDRSRNPDPGRGHQLRGYAHRGPDPEGHGAPHAGPHELRHCAPTLHHPGCEAHPGDGPWKDHRDGHAPGASRQGRLLRRAVQQPVHRREHRGGSCPDRPPARHERTCVLNREIAGFTVI
jgi:ATP-binding cassette subfamily B protein